MTLVYEAAGNPPKLNVLPAALLSLLALVNPTLRAVKEQQYRRDRSWVVDHARFARAFEAVVTPNADAIALTLAWWRREGQAPPPMQPAPSEPASA